MSHPHTFLVKVKWGKQKFEGVEVDTDESPEVFKMQLYSLSGGCVLRPISAFIVCNQLKESLLSDRR